MEWIGWQSANLILWMTLLAILEIGGGGRLITIYIFAGLILLASLVLWLSLSH